MFASGKKALGICDRCAFQWPLKKLKYALVGGQRTKLRVCPDCWDPYDPKDNPTAYSAKPEGIAVRDPRPESQPDAINSIAGFGPVAGCELPVFPVAEGFRMTDGIMIPAPQYILTEDGDFRLETEDGHLIALG